MGLLPPIAGAAAATPEPPGLLQRIANNPSGAQLMLLGLGLLGSKRRSQADRYTAGISNTLGGMAERQSRAPLQEAQIGKLGAETGYLEAQTLTESQNPYFEGTGGSTSAMRVVSELGAIAQTRPLTPKEQTAFDTAKAFLQRMQYVTTPSGMVPMAPMDLSYLDTPGAVPSAVAPDVPAVGQPLPDFIGAKDPFKEADAKRVVTTTETATKYQDMIPLLDAIEQDMAIFPTGKFSNLELALRGIDAATLGMTDDAVLASGERLDKNMNKLVSQNMEFLKGAMSEGEREFTKAFSLGMGTSVEGNLAYIGFLRAVAERASKQGVMMRKFFRENNNSLDGWDEYWQQYIEDNPVPIPEIKAGETLPEEGVFYDPVTGTWSDE